MFGGRGLSRVAARGNIGNISLIKPASPARSLSSIASRPFLAASRGDRLRLKANSYLPPASVSSLSFARFNSTSTVGKESVEATENATPELETPVPNIEDIPEHIGYLRELGLDYGWGPSSFMEWSIEHIHIMTQLPWWASIVAAALLTRVALFMPSVMAADNAARTSPVRDHMLLLRRQRLQLMSQGKQLEAAKAKVDMDDLYKNNGIVMWKSFLPLIQIPLGFGTFRVVRGMASLPVPALTTEEFSWIHNMTTYDPLYLLPVLTSVFMYLSIKKGAAAGTTDFQNSSLGRSFMYGLPTMSLLFIAWQPAALQMYFATSGLFALLQAYLLNTPTTRRWLGVAPIYKPNGDAMKSEGLRMIGERFASEIKSQAKDPKLAFETSASPTRPENISIVDKMLNNAKKEFSSMRKEMTDKVTEFTGNNATNSDGSPAAKPRLSAAEKADADSYKAQREIEDAHALAERNRQRTREYENFVAQQQAGAARSWQDVRKKAKETEASPTKKPTKRSRAKK